jgi:hypothetical protein
MIHNGITGRSPACLFIDAHAKVVYIYPKEERVMNVATMDEQTLKAILKAAIVEVLEERRDLVRDIVDEALEDAGLVAAIAEGEQTPIVSREDVFTALDTTV